MNHEAHIEAPETGTHRISISDQPGCNVGFVYVNSIRQPEPGPQDVQVTFPKTTKALTISSTCSACLNSQARACEKHDV